MDQSNPPRPARRHWHQVHVSSWLLVMPVAAALALANFPGERATVYPWQDCIAERRNAYAKAISAAEGDDPVGPLSFEPTLPTWLDDIISGWGVENILASLGWLRAHDVTFDFPEDQKHLDVVRSLLELDPENIHVMFTCGRRTRAHGSITTAELAPLRSLTGLRNLTLNGADDSVMACLDSLPNLRSLAIDEQSDSLTAEGVAHLRGLRQLRYLHAWPRCLGDEGMAVVQSLRSLEGLSLPGASGRDIACLANLNHLRWFNLPNTTATDIELAPLAKLTRLERLHLSGYRINGAGLASLGSLGRLWSLDLSRCGRSNEGMAAIGELRSLRDLDLTETPITGGLGHLAELGRLRRLDLSFTEISDAGLAEFPALPNLTELQLGWTRITEAGLAHLNRLTALRQLWMGNTRAKNLRTLDFARLRDLMLVEADSSWLEPEEYAWLSLVRPELDFNPVHYSRIHLHSLFAWQLAEARRRSPDSISPVRAWLCGPRFTDRDLSALAEVHPIETLRIESTRVTDAGMATVAKFRALKDVYLCDSPITDVGLLPLRDLRNLRHVDVSYSDVTQIGIAGLAEIPDLEVIGLDPSQVSVAVVEKLKRMPSLKVVTIDRQRAPWGKQYRGARDFDEFLTQLREDVPGISVCMKKEHEGYQCVEW